MNGYRTIWQIQENRSFATDLATRLRTTLTIGAIVTAACLTALAAWFSWYQTGAQDSAARRAWGDLERQRIEWKLGQSLAIAGAVSDSLAAMRDDPVFPPAIARNLLDDHHIGLAGAMLTVIDARGATIVDSAATRPDWRENPAVLEMLSNRRVAAEAIRDAAGNETGILIAHPITARDDGRVLGGVVLLLPQATLFAGGSLNGSYAALASREQLVGRGPAFAESSMFALHLDRPLDRLGLRLEIAAPPASHAWPPVLVLAVWLTAGALLGVLLIAIARWMSRFILAIRSGTTSRAEYAGDGSLFRRQANVLQFQRSSSRAATEQMSETRP